MLSLTYRALDFIEKLSFLHAVTTGETTVFLDCDETTIEKLGGLGAFDVAGVMLLRRSIYLFARFNSRHTVRDGRLTSPMIKKTRSNFVLRLEEFSQITRFYCKILQTKSSVLTSFIHHEDK